MAALPSAELVTLVAHARGLGLDALVEVHDEGELESALAAGADLIGINNRDLSSFEVDLAVTEKLASRLPEGVVVDLRRAHAAVQDHEKRSGYRRIVVWRNLQDPRALDSVDAHRRPENGLPDLVRGRERRGLNACRDLLP